MTGESIAFMVSGIGVTTTQRDAGIAAMTGQFKASNVRDALSRAGVPFEALDRAADRLMQSQRRLGNIRAINNKNWERLP